MKNDREIIFNAVRKARDDYYNKTHDDSNRYEISRNAAIIADKNGVNVMSAPYLQNIFHEALNRIL